MPNAARDIVGIWRFQPLFALIFLRTSRPAGSQLVSPVAGLSGLVQGGGPVTLRRTIWVIPAPAAEV